MQRDDTPETRGSGLSTEDLAAPREGEQMPGATSQPPAFPGEGDGPIGATEAPESREADTPVTDETTAAPAKEADETPQLLTTQDEEDFRKRWEKIQNTFVDDPREAV